MPNSVQAKDLLRSQIFGVVLPDLMIEAIVDQSRLGDFARVELGAFCAETDILDRTAVMQLLERRDGPRAWYLLNLALWWKQYLRSEAPAMALVGD